MKQYKIKFYHNRPSAPNSVCYREFETLKELKLWAVDFMKHDPSYCRYSYEVISFDGFLKNT